MSEQKLLSISVVIPTCHRNDLLAKCLDCLAPGLQTLPSAQYEVIVTDDGSRSTAQQMLRDFYPWVRWVEGPRRGPAANRNNGAAVAKGEWLAFTDDDCLPSAGWLEGYASSIKATVDVYEGRTTCAEGLKSPLYQSPINLTGGCLWSCNFMIHAALFQEVGGFDTEYAMPAMEDVDLHERLCEKGCKIEFVEDAITDHPPRRINSGNKSGRMYEAKVQYWNKRGLYKHSFVAYLKHIKHQVYTFTAFGLHRDVIIACWILLVEMFYVAPRLLSWEKKYRALYNT